MVKKTNNGSMYQSQLKSSFKILLGLFILSLGIGVLISGSYFSGKELEIFEQSPASYPVSIHHRLLLTEKGSDNMLINKAGSTVSVSEAPLLNTGQNFTTPLFVRNWTAGNYRQWTQFTVANPGEETAKVNFKIYDTEGNILKEINKEVTAKNQFNSYNDEDFISIPHTKDSRTLGWVKITSDKPISLHQRLVLRDKGNDNSTKDSDGGQARLSTETPLVDTATQFRSPLFLRNWTHGNLRQWNPITIANPGDEAVAVTFKIYKTDGDLATQFTKDIPAKGWFNSYNDEDFNNIPPTSDNKRFNGWLEIETAKSNVDFSKIPLARYKCPSTYYAINDRDQPSQYTWITGDCQKDENILGYGLKEPVLGTRPLYFLNCHISCGGNVTVLMTTYRSEIPYLDGNPAKPPPLDICRGCEKYTPGSSNTPTLGYGNKPVAYVYDPELPQPNNTIPLYRKKGGEKYFMVSNQAGDEKGMNDYIYKEDKLLGYILPPPDYKMCSVGNKRCSSDLKKFLQCSTDESIWEEMQNCGVGQACNDSQQCAAVPPEFSLNLKIDLESKNNNSNNSVLLRLSQGDQVVDIRDNVSINSSGETRVDYYIPAGSYRLVIKPKGYLSKAVDINISSGETKNITIGQAFLAGDIDENQDNLID